MRGARLPAITVTRAGVTRRMSLHGDRIMVTRDGEDGLIVGAPPAPHEIDRLQAHMGVPLSVLQVFVQELLRDPATQGPRPAA